jgi:hypothetical protein
MKKPCLLLCLFLFILTSGTFSQSHSSADVQFDQVSIGLGMGFDYGGFGGNVLYYPIKNVGVFGGYGYALAGGGYNAGLKFRLVPKNQSRFVPYATAMYGYNAAIYITGSEDYNKLFYGPSFGLGLDAFWNPGRKGYLSFALLFPVRGAEVNTYINDLKKNHNVKFENELLPVAFSIGYRFIL